MVANGGPWAAWTGWSPVAFRCDPAPDLCWCGLWTGPVACVVFVTMYTSTLQ
jgi:hypothetical protein